uniref:Uncharacterized protein n=1 Tax=Arundo donax TaxID=35708 RepID=A0A0A9GSZ5_ARUDO
MLMFYVLGPLLQTSSERQPKS